METAAALGTQLCFLAVKECDENGVVLKLQAHLVIIFQIFSLFAGKRELRGGIIFHRATPGGNDPAGIDNEP